MPVRAGPVGGSPRGPRIRSFTWFGDRGGPTPATRQPPSLPDLTGREIEILRLLARGYSNPEIAGRLHLAPGTVRNYVSTILHKLGVSDRTQAAVVAVQLGLVDGAQSLGPGVE